MKNHNHRQTKMYDDANLYKAASALRQVMDADWAIKLLPDRQFERCLDVGCGTGDLLGRLGALGRVSEQLVGIDRSQHMVQEAARRLRPLGKALDLSFIRANVVESPKLQDRFDLVTMMAVQHWLYPDESGVFAWISTVLEQHGVFCLTTYHPAVNPRSIGGSDDVVLEALEQIGAPVGFPPGFVPIGQRTRAPAELELLLRQHFRVYEMHVRHAVTRAATGKQYAQYHEATFGPYYLRIVHPRLRPKFLEAMGEAAMWRMKTLGYVTNMEVRFWVCGKARGRPAQERWQILPLLKSA